MPKASSKPKNGSRSKAVKATPSAGAVANPGSLAKATPETGTTANGTPGSNVASAAPSAAPNILVLVPTSPRDLLLRYQRRWADDDSRFKIGLMSRQVGKDFSSGEEGIRDCYKHELEKTKTNWLIGAPSERQALESLEKWKEWTEAYKLSIEDIIEERDHSEALLKNATIVFPHGSRCIAVPGRPDTVRGFSANLLLTEFAFFEDPDKTWRAVLPSVTNKLRGGEKRVRLISTPNGMGNKMHDLWIKNYNVPGAKWSCHFVDIHTAVAQGLPVDIEELREALDDPEGWAQEFECQFLDTASVLLPYELIALCENPQASLAVPFEYWLTNQPFPIVLGIDFGRKRDLTVCSAGECINQFVMVREMLELAKMSTPDQVNALRPRIRKAVRVCLDYQGPGVGMGDYLVKEFGEWKPEQHKYGKIELCDFTNSFKLENFPKLRTRFEAKMIGIPASRVLREDIHAIHRCVTPNGSITYRAPHTPDGHSDRGTSLVLMNRATQFLGGTGRIIVLNTRQSQVATARRNRSMEG